MWSGDKALMTFEDGLCAGSVGSVGRRRYFDGCKAFGSQSVVTVSVTLVVPKLASVRRMVPEIGTGGEEESVAVKVVIVISVNVGFAARWMEKRKGSRMRLPLLLLRTRSWDMKVWVALVQSREEVVGAAPGSREGSEEVIRFAIVDGSVWTRDVHDFVSSVATEERVALVQKREVEGRGIVQRGEEADEGGGG